MTVRTTLEKATRSILGATSPLAEAQSDILDTLQHEHDEVQELLEKLAKSDNGRERKSLVRRIKAALVPHTKAEEKVVYDAILALKDTQGHLAGTIRQEIGRALLAIAAMRGNRQLKNSHAENAKNDRSK